MADQQHTPGPWTMGPELSERLGTPGLTYSSEREIRCEHDPFCIATVSTGEGDENARLIAAAPDLLAAAKTAFECLENLMKAVPWKDTFGLDVGLLNEALCDLPKAIRKATGEK